MLCNTARERERERGRERLFCGGQGMKVKTETKRQSTIYIGEKKVHFLRREIKKESKRDSTQHTIDSANNGQ